MSTGRNRNIASFRWRLGSLVAVAVLVIAGSIFSTNASAVYRH